MARGYSAIWQVWANAGIIYALYDRTQETKAQLSLLEPVWNLSEDQAACHTAWSMTPDRR